MAQEGAKKRRCGMLHGIGNLTLLTKNLNPAVSNGPWAKKQKAILKDSAHNLNRPLSQIELWNEDLIEQCSKKPFAEASEIWAQGQDTRPSSNCVFIRGLEFAEMWYFARQR